MSEVITLTVFVGIVVTGLLCLENKAGDNDALFGLGISVMAVVVVVEIAWICLFRAL